MLRYWIVRRPDGSPAGLLRAENDRALLTLTAKIDGRFWLFSDVEAVPIVPDDVTTLAGAYALLGMDGDRETCCAAASCDVPLSICRERLSQIYTIEAKHASESEHEIKTDHTEREKPPEQPEQAKDISQISTIEAEEPADIDETARATESFSRLLRHAEAFYTAYETPYMVQKEDNDPSEIELFPQMFPGVRFRVADGPDVLPHYEGEYRRADGRTVRVLAARGRAAPRPPRAFSGFTRYLRGADGSGYWLRSVLL